MNIIKIISVRKFYYCLLRALLLLKSFFKSMLKVEYSIHQNQFWRYLQIRHDIRLDRAVQNCQVALSTNVPSTVIQWAKIHDKVPFRVPFQWNEILQIHICWCTFFGSFPLHLNINSIQIFFLLSTDLSVCEAYLLELNHLLQSMEVLHRTYSAPSIQALQVSTLSLIPFTLICRAGSFIITAAED